MYESNSAKGGQNVTELRLKEQIKRYLASNSIEEFQTDNFKVKVYTTQKREVILDKVPEDKLWVECKLPYKDWLEIENKSKLIKKMAYVEEVPEEALDIKQNTHLKIKELP